MATAHRATKGPEINPMPLFKTKNHIEAEQFTQAMADAVKAMLVYGGPNRIKGLGMGPFKTDVYFQRDNNYAAIYPRDTSDRENWSVATVGDWLIKADENDYSVVDDIIFRETYEPV